MTALIFAIFICHAEAATRTAVPEEEEGEEKWKLMREGDGIRVFVRKMKGTNVRQIRATMEVDASVKELLELVKDSESASEWIAQIKSFKDLEVISEREWYTYAEINVPWPFRDRDLVSFNKVSCDSGSLRVDIVSKPGHIPERDGMTRMSRAEGAWVFTPKEGGKTEVTYLFYSEPEVNILPQWLVAMLVSDGVHNTLDRMRERL